MNYKDHSVHYNLEHTILFNIMKCKRWGVYIIKVHVNRHKCALISTTNLTSFTSPVEFPDGDVSLKAKINLIKYGLVYCPNIYSVCQHFVYMLCYK